MGSNSYGFEMRMVGQYPKKFSASISTRSNDSSFHVSSVAKILYLCNYLHIYAVRRTAPVAFSALVTAASLAAETSAPVSVRSLALKTRVKARETLPSPIFS